MGFMLSDEQKTLQEQIRDWLRRFLSRQRLNLIESWEFPWDNFRLMAKMGFFGLTILIEYGGSGGDEVSIAIDGEELARAWAATSAVWMMCSSAFPQPTFSIMGTRSSAESMFR